MPLVGWHSGEKPGPNATAGLFANVTTVTDDVADIAASWAVVDSGGKAGVVIFTASQYVIALYKARAAATSENPERELSAIIIRLHPCNPIATHRSLPMPLYQSLIATPSALHVVVMGVSGCGKSTVGEQLAAGLNADYLEGDALHPARNVVLMAAGTPLTDEDRFGWLQALAQRLHQAHVANTGLVVTCSALKRSYRDILRSGCADLRLVHLHGSPELLAARLALRSGHYMPASLLPSQLQTLEMPQADEQALGFDIARPVDEIVRSALQQLTHTPITDTTA